jgi:crotonobetainyl-CoA:carnitine CoA-transferase CaiB-like acyl-CoA transferase
MRVAGLPLAQREMIVGYDHREIGPVPLPGNPVRMPGMDGTISHPAPRVGERTDEVPGALPRLSAEQAAGLRAKGAVR